MCKIIPLVQQWCLRAVDSSGREVTAVAIGLPRASRLCSVELRSGYLAYPIRYGEKLHFPKNHRLEVCGHALSFFEMKLGRTAPLKRQGLQECIAISPTILIVSFKDMNEHGTVQHGACPDHQTTAAIMVDFTGISVGLYFLYRCKCVGKQRLGGSRTHHWREWLFISLCFKLYDLWTTLNRLSYSHKWRGSKKQVF